ncbi:metalloregulator ArsR/SmtB family transcription factor [Synechococcales cyanobacterium C]|uniref:Metalloregulator ArsR/SmtB family transcription factor n=2 Tax=Petrachloros TaxID=2918834 RepID=A0A8K2A8M3_9CYAN|nr:metalloregulator ArsR/SmtB family transcription factor [Petrachloros mirabilis ULC683]
MPPDSKPSHLSEPDDAPTCTSDHGAAGIKPPLLDLAKAQRMAEFFSFLGDPTRLRILSVLADQELCVGDLAAILELSESATSHQLRALRALRLVSYRRAGRHVFYRLQDDHVLSLYQVVAEHLDHP